MVYPQEEDRRYLALPQVRSTERNDGAGGNVQARIAKASRPRTRQGQRLVADRKAERPVPGLKIEDHVLRDLAADSLVDFAHAAARRDHERRTVPSRAPQVPADAGEDDVLLERLVADEGLAPQSEGVDFGRPDCVGDDGPETPEVRSPDAKPRIAMKTESPPTRNGAVPTAMRRA